MSDTTLQIEAILDELAGLCFAPLDDEAREIVFPNGVPVAMIDEKDRLTSKQQRVAVGTNGKAVVARNTSRDLENANKVEGSLKNSDNEIQRHARGDEADDSENLID